MSYCEDDQRSFVGEDPVSEGESEDDPMRRDLRELTYHTELRHGGIQDELRKLSDGVGMLLSLPIVKKEQEKKEGVSDAPWATPNIPKPQFKRRGTGSVGQTPHPVKKGAYDGSPRPPHWSAKFGKDRDADLDTYIRVFTHHVDTYELDEKRAVQTFMDSLRGPLLDVVNGLSENPTWDEICTAARKRWNPRGSASFLSARFASELRKPDEDPMDYSVRLQQLARRAYGRYPNDLREQRVLEQFLVGQPKAVRTLMRGHQFEELDAAVDFVCRVEEDESSGSTVVKAKTRRTVPKARRTTTTDTSDDSDTDNRSRRAVADNRSRQTAAKEAPPEAAGWSELTQQVLGPSPTAVRELRRALETVECDEDGTFEDDDVYEVLQVRTGNSGFGKGACFFCNRKGHGWRKCFQLMEVLKRNGMRDSRQTGSRSSGNRSAVGSPVKGTPASASRTVSKPSGQMPGNA